MHHFADCGARREVDQEGVARRGRLQFAPAELGRRGLHGFPEILPTFSVAVEQKLMPQEGGVDPEVSVIHLAGAGSLCS